MGVLYTSPAGQITSRSRKKKQAQVVVLSGQCRYRDGLILSRGWLVASWLGVGSKPAAASPLSVRVQCRALSCAVARTTAYPSSVSRARSRCFNHERFLRSAMQPTPWVEDCSSRCVCSQRWRREVWPCGLIAKGVGRSSLTAIAPRLPCIHNLPRSGVLRARSLSWPSSHRYMKSQVFSYTRPIMWLPPSVPAVTSDTARSICRPKESDKSRGAAQFFLPTPCLSWDQCLAQQQCWLRPFGALWTRGLQ